MATGGGGDGGFGAAGTLSVNLISSTVEAKILNSTTTIDSTGNLTLLAKDNSAIFSFAGAFGAGKTAGIGAALALNFLNNKTRAVIEASTLRTTGAFSAIATETGKVVTVSVGGAGADKFAVAGGIAVNKLTNTIEARVSAGSDILVGGAVLVSAKDDETSVAIVGGGAGSGKAALGASVGANLITNTTTAQVDDA